MNVYNESHNLATAIKESEEYKHYAELRDKIEANSSLSAMVNDIRAKQLDLQMKQMQGTLEGDYQQHIMELYQLMVRDPLMAQYFEAEARFSLMMQDVYKIINEAVGMSFDFPGADGVQ